MPFSDKKAAPKNDLLRKDTCTLIDQSYNTPKTSLLTYHFEPSFLENTKLRIEKSNIAAFTIEDKQLYVIDQYFSPEESDKMVLFSENSSFSQELFPPSKMMVHTPDNAFFFTNKELWDFFSSPPSPIKEFFNLFHLLSYMLNADIALFPWYLANQTLAIPAIQVSKIQTLSSENSYKAKEQNNRFAKSIPFELPVLYRTDSQKIDTFTSKSALLNTPLMFSAILYATANNFITSYGLGTLFYKNMHQEAIRVGTRHMRLLLFENGIPHTIEPSHYPNGISSWISSYSFRIWINPKQEVPFLKSALHNALIRDTNI